MALEEQLSELNTNLKALVVAIATIGGAVALAGAATTTATPAKGTKAADTKSATAGKKETSWDDVVSAVKDLNATDGRGRPAVEHVLEHFGVTDKKVPPLKALEKNAEIVAYIATVKKDGVPEAAAEDDFGV